MDYATVEDLKERFSAIPDDDDTEDGSFQAAITAASRAVDDYCNRSFGLDDDPSPRRFVPVDGRRVHIDDAAEVVSVSVAGSMLSGDAVNLYPLNGVYRGQSGWPYRRVVSVVGDVFPIGSASVTVTAVWGWPDVPAVVREATLIVAEETWKLRDTPFGIAGSAEFGQMRVPRFHPRVIAMLSQYRRDTVMVNE